MKLQFTILVLLGLLCHSTLGDHHGDSGGRRGGGDGDGPRGEPKDFKKKGRGAGGDEHGRHHIKSDDGEVSFELDGYSEKTSDGTEIAEHTVTGANITAIINTEIANDELPFSEREGATSGEKIRAACIVTTETFDSGTVLEMKSCVATDNGTITLGQGDNQEVFDVKEGYMKSSITVTNHVWCGTVATDVACADGAEGVELCIRAKMRGPGAPNKKSRGGRTDGKRPPQEFELGNNARMFLSTLVAVLSADDPENVEEWIQMNDDDVDIEADTSENEDDQKGAKGKFCLPKGTAGKTLWYDPLTEVDGDEYTGDDDDNNAAPTMLVATLLTLVSSLIALLL